MEGKDIDYKAHALRELFKGRFTQQDIRRVLEEFDNNEYQALDFLLCENPVEISRFLKKSPDYIENLQKDSEDLQEFLENSEIVVRPTERLFACMDCNRSWWKKVPFRKEVSRCKKCLVRYDAIPKDKEWGIGVFHCPNPRCSKEFRGWAIMGMTSCICYHCKTPVLVKEIVSPKKSERTGRSLDTHTCNGFNCYNRNVFAATDFAVILTFCIRLFTVCAIVQPCAMANSVAKRIQRSQYPYHAPGIVAICVHPKSRDLIPPGSNFLVWSMRHASSGSTVSTFLDQGSLSSRSGIIPIYEGRTQPVVGGPPPNVGPPPNMGPPPYIGPTPNMEPPSNRGPPPKKGPPPSMGPAVLVQNRRQQHQRHTGGWVV